jgi:hypothetical protein
LSLSAGKFRDFEIVKNYQRRVYCSNFKTQSYDVNNLERILENPNFDRRKRTAIYSYGFTQTVYQPSVREVVDAYQQNGEFNFLLVNYRSILAYNVLVR